MNFSQKIFIMNRLKISIITPTYNSIASLKRTLDSVAAQTLQPYEYIIMDGGSTDGTVEMARQHPAVTKLISEKDKGIADAFNKGIALATGDIIGIINADDWYAEDALERVERAMQGGADVAHGIMQYWEGNIAKAIFYPNFSALHKEMTLNHPTVFVRRQVYLECGSFDLSYNYAMDYELLLRFKVRGKQFVQIAGGVVSNMALGGISDLRWAGAYKESRQAKIVHLHNPTNAWLYYCWQIVRTATRRALQKAGIDGLVQLWRNWFSIMGKK
jgi:glycosyltransferase involved in cell wall biosynthesis